MTVFVCDPTSALARLKELAAEGAQSRARRWTDVRDLWLPGCTGAVAEDPDFLAPYVPGAPGVAPPLDALQGRVRDDWHLHMARSLAGLAQVCARIADQAVAETGLVAPLNAATQEWRECTRAVQPGGLATPPVLGRRAYTPGTWPLALAPDAALRPARIAAQLVDDLAGNNPDPDLYALRELLWGLLRYSRTTWTKPYQLRVLVDRASSPDSNAVDLTVVSRPGAGAWFADPSQPWLRADEAFTGALASARAYASDHFDVDAVDVCWRLDLESVRGASSGVALAALFRYCDPAYDYDVDPSWAPTGDPTDRGKVGRVHGYESKLTAAWRRTGTKVVVPRRDLGEAQKHCPPGLVLQHAEAIDEVCRIIRRLARRNPPPDRPAPTGLGDRLEEARRAMLEGPRGRPVVLSGSDEANADLVAGIWHDVDLRREFTDFVRIDAQRNLPITFNLGQVIGTLRAIWGAEAGATEEPAAWSTPLRALLAHRRALVVVTGVSEAGLIEAMDEVGDACAILVTTSDIDVVALAPSLTIQAAPAFSAELAKRGVPRDAIDRALRRGYDKAIPPDLAAALAIKAPYVFASLPEGYDGLRRATESVVEGLAAELRELLDALACMPPDTPIPLGILAEHWALDEPSASAVARALRAEAIVWLDGDALVVPGATMRTVRDRLPDGVLEASRASLLGRWRPLVGAADRFVLTQLPLALRSLGRIDELADLVVSFDWLHAMLVTEGPTALLAHLDLADDGDVNLVAAALRLSARALARDPRELPGQLVGRLGVIHRPRIRRLVADARREGDVPALTPAAATLARPLGRFRGSLIHGNGITAIAATPDGRLALTGGVDGTVRVWDLATSRPLSDLRSHCEAVSAAVFTESGHVVTADETGGIAVSAPQTGAHIGAGRVQGSRCRCLAAGHGMVIAGLDDGRICRWDPESCSWAGELGRHEGAVRAIAVAADARRAVSTGDDGAVRVWNLAAKEAGAIVARHDGPATDVAIAFDGRRAVSASAGGAITVWDLDRRVIAHQLSGHTGEVRSLAFTADGRFVTGADDWALQRWELPPSDRSAAAPSTRVSVDGRRLQFVLALPSRHGELVLTSSFDGVVRVWDLAAPSVPDEDQRHVRSVSAACIVDGSPTGFTASLDGRLLAWDLDSGACLGAAGDHGAEVTAVASVAGASQIVSGGTDGTVCLWDARLGITVQRVSPTSGDRSPVAGLAVSGNGRWLAWGDAGGEVHVWRLNRGSEPRSMSGHELEVLGVAITPDGRTVLSAGADATLRQWDVATGQEVDCRDHDDWVVALALSADGSLAVTGSDAGTVRTLPLSGHGPARKVRCHDGAVTAVAVATDGSLVVSGSDDHSMVVWDIRTGDRFHLRGHLGPVRAVCLSRDASQVVSCATDRTVRVWDLNARSQIAGFTADESIPMVVSTGNRNGPFLCGDESGRVHVLRVVR